MLLRLLPPLVVAEDTAAGAVVKHAATNRSVALERRMVRETHADNDSLTVTHTHSQPQPNAWKQPAAKVRGLLATYADGGAVADLCEKIHSIGPLKISVPDSGYSSSLHLHTLTQFPTGETQAIAPTMGKKGSGTGVNTKVQAAREKQAALEGARAAKARVAEEAAEAKEWSKGANARGSKREEDAARKQDEKATKLAAKKALQAQEAEQLAGFKSVVVSETDSSSSSSLSGG